MTVEVEGAAVLAAGETSLGDSVTAQVDTEPSGSVVK